MARIMTQARIDKIAEEVGNKAANLLELQELGHHVTSLPILVKIPELLPLNHRFIIAHLDKVATNWR